jgi:hypothetical protein
MQQGLVLAVLAHQGGACRQHRHEREVVVQARGGGHLMISLATSHLREAMVAVATTPWKSEVALSRVQRM